MKFSIVVPLFNKEKHIVRAINSILKQTHQDFEILIIDDGSTDLSYNKAISIKDSRIKVYRKKNEGVSSARNFGVQHSTCEYIAFLDADDEWKPMFLESIIKMIKKYPEAGAYATSYEFKDQGVTRRANINVNLNEEEFTVVDYFKCSLNDPLISASSVVIKKSVFEHVGFFSTRLTRGEDLEMWCRIALNYPIVFLNKVLATYYLDSENKLTRMERNYSESFLSIAEQFLDKYSKKNKSLYFKEYMIKIIMNKIRYFIDIGKRKQARELLWKYMSTKYSKKIWIKNYLLSYKIVYKINQKLKNKNI